MRLRRRKGRTSSSTRLSRTLLWRVSALAKAREALDLAWILVLLILLIPSNVISVH